MNPNWSDAQNWLDLLDHIWIGLVVIAAAAVPSVFAARNHRSISDIKREVKNAHSTNLRDDIDRAINAIEHLAHDVRTLRSDLMTEEDRRRQQIAELRADVDRRR